MSKDPPRLHQNILIWRENLGACTGFSFAKAKKTRFLIFARALPEWKNERVKIHNIFCTCFVAFHPGEFDLFVQVQFLQIVKNYFNLQPLTH